MMSKNSIVPFLKDYLIKFLTRPFLLDTNDSEYNVEQLSADMGMSRMNLYRKLQAITGQTPTEFIRTIRLKRAAQLLQDGKLNVSEVADRVGFSSSSYFTKCFKEQFGVLPTQYSETDESGKTDEK